MPKHTKKPFIDKKSAVTFHLVHRSQRDPLAVDHEAGQRVLVPVGDDSTRGAGEDPSIRLEEQQKYGVDADDDYNYMQHLRSLGEFREVAAGHSEGAALSRKLGIPSKAFPSQLESKEKFLSRTSAPSGFHVDWDPEIVETLDDEFDHAQTEEPEDDFFLNANESGDEQERGETDEYSSRRDEWLKQQQTVTRPDVTRLASEYMEHGDGDAAVSCGGDEGEDSDSFNESMLSFGNQKRADGMTNYSMSSSVMRRNKGLTLVDDMFESVMDSYTDMDIGAIEHEDVEGYLETDGDVLNRLAEEFERSQQKVPFVAGRENQAAPVITGESDEEEEKLMEIEVKPKPRFDCESILSTYSNLYNHPKVISCAKKSVSSETIEKRQAATVEESALTREEIAKSYRRDRACSPSVPRSREETLEEKKQRKQVVKAKRKERRIEKKATKTEFMAEKLRQGKELVNLKNNLQGTKLA